MKKFLLIFCFLTLFGFNAKGQDMKNMQLTNQQKQMVSISSLAALGNLPALKNAIDAGLEAGLSVNEVKEILIQLYAYAGFPRSLNAINTLITVLDERKAAGQEDLPGVEPTLVAGVDKYALGRQNYSTLFGDPDALPRPRYEQEVPAIEVFLKEHLFADIFGRGVLTYQDRELVTISILASISGLGPQLKSHMQGGLNAGLSIDQIREIVQIVQKNVDQEQADTIQGVFNQLIQKQER